MAPPNPNREKKLFLWAGTLLLLTPKLVSALQDACEGSRSWLEALLLSALPTGW